MILFNFQGPSCFLPHSLSRLGAYSLYHTQQLLSSTFLIFSFAPFRSAEVTAYLSYHIFQCLSTPFFRGSDIFFSLPAELAVEPSPLGRFSHRCFSAFRRVLTGQLVYNTTLFLHCQHLFLKKFNFFCFSFKTLLPCPYFSISTSSSL